jgi:hypothetical protein
MNPSLRRSLRQSIGMAELVLNGLTVVSDSNAGGTSREYRRALARQTAREAKKNPLEALGSEGAINTSAGNTTFNFGPHV